MQLSQEQALNRIEDLQADLKTANSRNEKMERLQDEVRNQNKVNVNSVCSVTNAFGYWNCLLLFIESSFAKYIPVMLNIMVVVEWML